jgi:hypothetical protein
MGQNRQEIEGGKRVCLNRAHRCTVDFSSLKSCQGNPIFFISPLLSLTGFSLCMNIFHFKAFALSA